MSGILEELALVPNNTYNYSNSNVFYSLVNASYLDYYQRTIRKCQEWLDGYDPSFHKAANGIFSSRIGHKISRGIATQIFGRGLVYANGKGTTTNEALDYISHTWADKVNFNNVIKQLISYCYPLGTALIKTNRDKDGEIWVEALRADYFYFQTNPKGELTEVKTFIRAFQSTERKDKNYCLVERRYYEYDYPKLEQDLFEGKIFYDKTKGKTIKKPMVNFCIFEINSTASNNTLASNSGDGLNWKSIPSDIQKQLKEAYGVDFMFNEPRQLPFTDLGCDLFKNEGGDATHPGMPFGNPALFDLISSFMEYDLECSYSIRDLFNSKGIVGIPKALTQSTIVPGTGGHASQSPYSKLNIAGYEQVEGLDPDKQAPIITQFEMRAVEHEAKQNAILKSIATAVGMSPRVIASYLVGGNEKTAEQVHSEDDTITNWIKSHRADYIFGLNSIIERVLTLKGFTDNVEVKFASDGLVNEERQIAIIKDKLDMGIIDIEDAIRELYPDLDEVQLQSKINKANQRVAQQKQQRLTQFDSFGDELE